MDRSEWQQRNLDPGSRALLDRDASAYLHQAGSTPCIATIKSADGVWLEDHAGKRYLDLYGNSCHHLGYRHPRLVAALTAQLNELTFSPRRFANQPAVELAEMLLKRWPGGEGQVLLATGGSDAIELAMKIARVATGRYKTVSFYDSYHGNGFGALSVGGRHSDRSPRLGPLLEGALHVPPFYRRDESAANLPCDDPRWAEESFAAMEFVFARERDIAAVIAEPIRSTPHIPPDWYWPQVRALCDKHGVLLIFDEIPTGLGKTGRLFSSEHVGARPDMTVLGKALGAGMPVSAVSGRRALFAPIVDGKVTQRGTYNGFPLAVAAGIACIDYLTANATGIYPRLERHAQAIAQHVLAVAARSGVPVTANQIGPCVQLFAGIASVPTLRHLAEVDKNRTLVLTGALVDRGVAPLPRGMMYLSAAHTDADIDATLAALGTAIAALA